MDLFEKYGKKRYIISSSYSDMMKEYLKNKQSKDFTSKLNKFIKGEIQDPYEIGLFLSSLITHTILASRYYEESNILDTRTIAKCLDDYLSGDVNSVEFFIKELSDKMNI